MKNQISNSIQIPEGVSCLYEGNILTCRKGSTELKREINIPRIEVKIENNAITFVCQKGNKNQHKIIMTFLAHIANIFRGLEEKFVYELESVSVHFPMTLKIEGNKLIINNFLGEKVPRHAEILPNVDVEIKGNHITVSSQDREAAGQTSANFERATRVRAKDNRIFQDGIYVVEKPARRENV